MQQAAKAEAKVMQALTKYLPQGSRVLLAVSGGADSMALALAAAQLRENDYFETFVLHVEHGLRGAEALQDAELVQNFCHEHNLPYNCHHVDVAAYADANGLSTESAARKLRYAALQDEAVRLKTDYIVTAHHADDQAETVLLKLLRGTSAAGLSGMSHVHGNIIRPFLELSRADLVEFCDAFHVKYCHDSSNDDVAYTRNRIRRELLPYLEQRFNPSVRQTLIQTATLLSEDEAYFDKLVQAAISRRVQQNGNEVILEVTGWGDMPAPVRKRLLRACYFMAGANDNNDLSYRQTNAMDAMCLKGDSGKRLNLTGRITASYAYEKLQLAYEQGKNTVGQKDSAQFTVQIAVPAEKTAVTVPGGVVELTSVCGSFSEVLKKYADGDMQLLLKCHLLLYPMELLNDSLTLRHRCSGDRFSPYGGAGSKKLKDYFIDKKVPRTERDKKLLLCCGDKILGIFTVAVGAWKQSAYQRWLLAKYTEQGSANDE